ncbi:hypothetical protein Tco_0065069 [Tanacetum coccineum]
MSLNNDLRGRNRLHNWYQSLVALDLGSTRFRSFCSIYRRRSAILDDSMLPKRLATSSTFPICSIAFSVELPKKVVLRNSLKSCPLISSVALTGLLILPRVLLRIHKKYRCCGLEQAKCLFWPKTVFQDWRTE